MQTVRKETRKLYDFVQKGPVARFYYQGCHAHPVRRTVLVVEETATVLTGYEVREGKSIREVRKAPIKSFRKDKIANFGDYSRLKMNKEDYQRLDSESTLVRSNLEELVRNGA